MKTHKTGSTYVCLLIVTLTSYYNLTVSCQIVYKQRENEPVPPIKHRLEWGLRGTIYTWNIFFNLMKQASVRYTHITFCAFRTLAMILIRYALDKKLIPLLMPDITYSVEKTANQGYYPWDETYRMGKSYEFFGFHVDKWTKSHFQ